MSIEGVAECEHPRLGKLIEERKSGDSSGLSRSNPALIVIAVLVLLFQLRSLPEELAGQSLATSVAAQQRKETKLVRLVVIDDNDYKNLFSGTSPLNPDTLSKLLESIAAGGAKALVVDIDTSARSYATMKVPSVPTVWAAAGQVRTDGKFTVDARPLGGREMPTGSTMALADVQMDDRGVVKGYRRVYDLEDGNIAESPGYALVSLLNGVPGGRPTAGAQNERSLDFRHSLIPIRASDVLSDAKSNTWKDISIFKGQVVVVGASYRPGNDRYATQAGLLDGCEIIAQEVQAEIDGTSVLSASRWLTGFPSVLGTVSEWLGQYKASWIAVLVTLLGLITLRSSLILVLLQQDVFLIRQLAPWFYLSRLGRRKLFGSYRNNLICNPDIRDDASRYVDLPYKWNGVEGEVRFSGRAEASLYELGNLEIVAEGGRGKTAFCRHLAVRFLEIPSAPARRLQPVIIDGLVLQL